LGGAARGPRPGEDPRDRGAHAARAGAAAHRGAPGRLGGGAPCPLRQPPPAAAPRPLSPAPGLPLPPPPPRHPHPFPPPPPPLPRAVLATFGVMSLAGFTLNQMSLLGLALAIGILVDDSILVLDSISRHRQMGKPPRQAALDGRQEIGFADATNSFLDVVIYL